MLKIKTIDEIPKYQILILWLLDASKNYYLRTSGSKEKHQKFIYKYKLYFQRKIYIIHVSTN